MRLLPRATLLALTAALSLLPIAIAQDKDGKSDPKDLKKPLFEAKGELTDKDPMDKFRKQSYHKVHEFKMEAGKTYRIEVRSPDFDTLLRVEDANGKMLGLDDDGAGDGTLNSKLAFTAPADGDYKLIVTSFPPSETGKYTIKVSEPTKGDLLFGQARNFPKLSGEERAKFLGTLLDHLNEAGAKISPSDAQLAFQVGMAMEQFKTPGVADWYAKLGKALSQSSSPQIRKMAGAMEGSARRVRLIGNQIEVKGPLLDGKEIDWKDYRGKVVLVDFWATWCGPCIAEIPRMKKMYEAYKGKGFDIVGISLDQDAEKPAKFMEKRELPWPCIFDESQPLATRYGVMAIPLAILVDKEGRVVSLNARGPELERLLEQQLGPIPEPKTDEKKSE